MSRVVEIDDTDFDAIPDGDQTYTNISGRELAIPVSASQIVVLAPNAELVVPKGTFELLPAAAGAIGALLGVHMLHLKGVDLIN